MAYPSINKNARLMKRSEFCWFIDKENHFNDIISNEEAVFLACCNGSFTYEEISDLIQMSLGEGKLEGFISKFAHLISDEKNTTSSIRYNPADFLYAPKPGRLWHSQRLESPVEALLSLTYACNFNCIYCFNSSGKRHEDELTTAEWLNVVQQLAEMDVGVVTLTGGEPMLHPGFFEIAEEIVKHGMFAHICTNGSLINSDSVKRMVNTGINLIQISFDATEESFDKMTGVKGSYNTVYRAVRQAIASNIKVHVKGVITSENIANITLLCDILEDLGVSCLELDRYDSGPICRSGGELMVTDKQIEEMKANLLKKNISIRIKIADAKKRWLSSEDIIPCGAFRRNILIMPDGDFNGCEKMAGMPELSIGNVRDNLLKNLWYSEKIDKIITPRKENISSVCAECEHYDICNTGCYAIKRFMNLHLHDIDPRCFKAPSKNNIYALL